MGVAVRKPSSANKIIDTNSPTLKDCNSILQTHGILLENLCFCQNSEILSYSSEQKKKKQASDHLYQCIAFVHLP